MDLLARGIRAGCRCRLRSMFSAAPECPEFERLAIGRAYPSRASETWTRGAGWQGASRGARHLDPIPCWGFPQGGEDIANGRLRPNVEQ